MLLSSLLSTRRPCLASIAGPRFALTKSLDAQQRDSFRSPSLWLVGCTFYYLQGVMLHNFIPCCSLPLLNRSGITFYAKDAALENIILSRKTRNTSNWTDIHGTTWDSYGYERLIFGDWQTSNLMHKQMEVTVLPFSYIQGYMWLLLKKWNF